MFLCMFMFCMYVYVFYVCLCMFMYFYVFVCTKYIKIHKNMSKIQPNGIWKNTSTSDENVGKSNFQFSLVWMSNGIWKRLALFRMKNWDQHPKLLNRALTAKMFTLLTKISKTRISNSHYFGCQMSFESVWRYL